MEHEADNFQTSSDMNSLISNQSATMPNSCQKTEKEEVTNLSVFLKFVKRRIKNNRNLIVIFVGATGTGKSFSAMSLAEKIHEMWQKDDPNFPSFSIKNVAFHASEFLKLVHAAKDMPNIPRGSVIVYDEAGISLGSRTWFSETNRILNYCLQIFRYKNLITFMTLPDMSLLDSQSRKLAHAVIQTSRIDREKNECFVKPYILEVNLTSGKIYRKYIKFWSDDTKYTLSEMALKLPSVVLRREYDKKKQEYADKLYEDSIGKLRLNDMSEAEKEEYELKKKKDNPLYKKIEKMILEYKTVAGSSPTHDWLSKQLGIARATITQHITKMRRLDFNV